MSDNGSDSNLATVRTFLQLLEEGNIDAWIELWADDADHYYPYGQEMFPGHIVGKSAIYDRWRNMPTMFQWMRFLPLRETWCVGDTVIATFDSECLMKTGQRYANNYICIFKFDDTGKIKEYWEYFDPILAGVSFGLAEVKYLTAV